MKIFTVAEYIVHELKNWGITVAFGICGSHYLSLFKAMENEGMEFYSVKHEAAAGFMALHYARAAQKPALCLGTAGPGILNLVNGIGELYKSQIPALIISPMVSANDFGKNGMQEDTGLGTTYSINNLMQPITKLTERLDEPGKIPVLLHRILSRLFQTPSGPVHFSVPSNYLDMEIEPCNTEVPVKIRSEPQKCDTGNTIDILRNAKFPVLLAGLRAIYPDEGEVIVKLSKKFSIPVITSFAAKGLLDESDPLCLGVLDAYGHKSAAYFIKKSDCVISIGYDFGAFSTLKYDKKLINGKLVQIDTIVDDLDRVYRAHEKLVGPIRYILENLIDKLEHVGYKGKSEADIIAMCTAKTGLDADCLHKQLDVSNPLKPQRIYRLIRDALQNRDYMVTVDIGASSFWAMKQFTTARSSFQAFANNYSMGQGIGGVLGAKIAKPGKFTVCISGDGSFLMHGTEVLTAKHYKKGILYIIFVDNTYNLVSSKQKRVYGMDSGYATKFTGLDYDLLARAYGIPGHTIDSEEEFDLYIRKYMEIIESENSTPCILAVNYDSNESLL